SATTGAPPSGSRSRSASPPSSRRRTSPPGGSCRSPWRRCSGSRSGEKRELAGNPPGADIRVGVPAAEAGDLDDGARVRGVDELVAADVEADVAEAVEEDEIARLEVAARDRNADAPLRAC